ncbi:MAG TPA: MaoC/PaaZ C-terminal domain-containing protein [Sphingobium sp.]|nr:MaoC/PaaZ C-terminal domain-containing protein [Sphingobium sp.]
MRYYEDILVNEKRMSHRYIVTESEIIAFAREFDPQWFHTEPLRAKDSMFGGLVASGCHVLSLWRKMDHSMNGDIQYCCGVGLDDIKFRMAVHPGDALTLESEVVEKRLSKSDHRFGLVKMIYKMRRDESVIMTLAAVNLVYRDCSRK